MKPNTVRPVVKSVVAASLSAALAVALLACSSENTPPTGSETTPPSVIATSPATEETQVSTNTVVTIIFSEAVDPGSVTVLVNGLVRGPITVADSVVTMTLDHRLFHKSVYTAVVPAGVSDLAGNRMETPHVWTFTTGFGPLGETWTRQSLPAAVRLNRVVWGSDEFFAVGSGGTMLRSQDGAQWLPVSYQPAVQQLWSAFPVGDRYIVAGSPATVVFSSNQYSWGQDNLSGQFADFYDLWVGYDAIYLAGTSETSGGTGVVVKYVSPGNWETNNIGSGVTPRSITRFGDGYVAVGDDGFVSVSRDGDEWDVHSFGAGDLRKVRWVARHGLLIGVGSAVYTSSDGIIWTQRTPAGGPNLNDVMWTSVMVGGEDYTHYCAVGDGGTIITSEDAVHWKVRQPGVTNDLYGISCGRVPARFVAVGDNVVLTSE